MLKRILSVFRANIFGQLITIIIQIVSVPIFLHFWGSNLYGEWLILTAIPSYIIVSGTGIGFVAGNTMQKHISNNQPEEALSVFQSAWLLSLALTFCLLCITVTILLCTPDFKLINIKSLKPEMVKATLIVLTLYVLLTLQTELYSGAYRANGRYARSISILNILRLAEFLGVMIIVSLGATVLSCSVFYLSVRIFVIIYMLFDLNKFASMRLGFKKVNKKILKSELLPTFSFLGFPVGHACLIQGMTTIIGIRLGPSSVVIFSVIRTLIGFIKQFSSTIYYSVWPEFSRTLSIGDLKIARDMHRIALQITFLFSVVSGTFLYCFGEWIIQIWTGSKISVEENFFLFMLISAIPNTLWMTSSYVSISINKHSFIAFIYSILAIIALLISYYLLPYLGLLAISIATLFSDILTFYFVLSVSLKIVQESAKRFFHSILFSFPLVRLSSYRTK